MNRLKVGKARQAGAFQLEGARCTVTGYRDDVFAVLERVMDRTLQNAMPLRRKQVCEGRLKPPLARTIQPVFDEPLDHAILRAWSP